jgi:succinyl-CoA synthetase beta subunit
MNIHEFQAKQVLQTFEVPVLAGFVARSGAEAEEAARKLPGPIYVVKAQIHAGGRGAGRFRAGTDHAGGVRVTKSTTEARAAADAMINNVLITKQTGPAGRLVRQVYVEAGVDISRELYFSALIDRETGWVTLLASSEGGMDIEDVAARHPDKIIRVGIDPASGLGEFHIRRLGYGLGIPFKSMRDFGRFVTAIYQAFVELDCSVIEINPLIVTAANEFVALDAKVSFDDNGLFRHPEIEELRDEAEEDPRERAAARQNLSYVAMDGSIGCMVNGAGLAMATMDIIKLYGGSPANFLDVGGGATKERVSAAFKIILSDPKVRAILVNIFGGIMRCDVIAEGIVAAARQSALTMPLVVRLEGTNVQLGRDMLAKSGLLIIPADNLADAAEKVVRAAQGKA